MERPIIVAEVGCNHMGDMEIAKELVDVFQFNNCLAFSLGGIGIDLGVLLGCHLVTRNLRSNL